MKSRTCAKRTARKLVAEAHTLAYHWQAYEQNENGARLLFELSDALTAALKSEARIASCATDLMRAMSEWNDVFQTRMDCFDALVEAKAPLQEAILDAESR